MNNFINFISDNLVFAIIFASIIVVLGVLIIVFCFKKPQDSDDKKISFVKEEVVVKSITNKEKDNDTQDSIKDNDKQDKLDKEKKQTKSAKGKKITEKKVEQEVKEEKEDKNKQDDKKEAKTLKNSKENKAEISEKDKEKSVKKQTKSSKQEDIKKQEAKQTKEADTEIKEQTQKENEADNKSESAKPTHSTYRVKYDSVKKDWVVKKDGASKAYRRFMTKEEATHCAKLLAKRQDSNFALHKKDGKFQKKKYD